MSPNKHTITDSEYEIMKILWASREKLTVAHVVQALDDHRWTASTVSTFLQRLLKKEVVGCEKKGKTNLYYPLLLALDMLALHKERYRLVACVQSPVDYIGAFGNEQTLF